MKTIVGWGVMVGDEKCSHCNNNPACCYVADDMHRIEPYCRSCASGLPDKVHDVLSALISRIKPHASGGVSARRLRRSRMIPDWMTARLFAVGRIKGGILMLNKSVELLLAALVISLSFCLLGFIFVLPIYFLFNWIGPAVFSLHEITFLQAFGLYLLCALLFHTNSSTKGK